MPTYAELQEMQKYNRRKLGLQEVTNTDDDKFIKKSWKDFKSIIKDLEKTMKNLENQYKKETNSQKRQSIAYEIDDMLEDIAKYRP